MQEKFEKNIKNFSTFLIKWRYQRANLIYFWLLIDFKRIFKKISEENVWDYFVSSRYFNPVHLKTKFSSTYVVMYLITKKKESYTVNLFISLSPRSDMVRATPRHRRLKWGPDLFENEFKFVCLFNFTWFLRWHRYLYLP